MGLIRRGFNQVNNQRKRDREPLILVLGFLLLLLNRSSRKMIVNGITSQELFKALHFRIMNTLGSLTLNLGGRNSAICDRSGVQLEHPSFVPLRFVKGSSSASVLQQ
jgi:hypothetical protein